MSGTSRPTIARAVSESWPKICDTQNVSKPCLALRRASSTSSSSVPPLIAALMVPSRMRGDRSRAGSGQRDELQPVLGEVVDLAVGHQQDLVRGELLDELRVVADEHDR